MGKSIPDSTGTAKALRLELAELVLRRTRRPVWPEGSEGKGKREWQEMRSQRKPGGELLAWVLIVENNRNCVRYTQA